ncbi:MULTISPECIES: hypothetical protein [Salinivibrio]|nr:MULTISPECIES: hypothetical protein [Salinivibrio]
MSQAKDYRIHLAILRAAMVMISAFLPEIGMKNNRDITITIA